MIRHLTLAATLLAAPLPQVSSEPEVRPIDRPGARPEALVVARGEGQPEMRLPREEKLVFNVHLALAFLEADVGTVTMRSVVEPFRPSLFAPPAAAGESGRETATLMIHARGQYAWYEMNATIETRILPQAWPRLSYRYTSEGSERRRREIQIGEVEEGWGASYRRDTDKNAPPGTRIWRDAKTRSVPPQSLDLLSAVYLSRTLIEDDLDEIRFPLLDKLRLWQMRLTRGERRRFETAAGTFDAVEMQLLPEPWEGEDIDPEDVERFEGLFGLHGAIHLWVEERTGVPVFIAGTLPAGPLDLDLEIELKGYEGTPPGFVPVPVER